MVEKSAGESGVAGNLKQKWLTFLESPSGKEIAARLAIGGVPVVDSAVVRQ